MGSASPHPHETRAAGQERIETAPPVLLDVEDGVAWVTLNRPQSLNAMNGALMDGLRDALASVAENDRVRCVVVRGAGPSFCAGGDVGMIAERRQQAAEAPSLGALLDVQHRELERRSEASLLLHTMPKPTIAVLHGHVVGGGLGLALAADLRLAAAGTRLRVQFSRVGLSGDYGITYFLVHLVGSAKARELLMLDPPLETDEALRLGLLTEVHPATGLAGAAEGLARRLADGPTIAFGRMKDNLRAAATQSLEEVLRLEALNQRFSANAAVVRSGGRDATGEGGEMTVATTDGIPRFAELPTAGDTGERHSWDVFGPGDELGCLNFISPEHVVSAAQEVVCGTVVNLNLPLGEPSPQFWASRTELQHHKVIKRNIRDDYVDGLAMQGSTQWDGFRHQRFKQFGFYGGRQDHDLDTNGELGIEHWARRGIHGRGVLADVAGHMRERGTPLAPDQRLPIGGKLLEEVLEGQGTTLRPGDILLIRTGWLEWYQGMDSEVRTRLSERLNADRSLAALPGIDPRQETAGWLWDHRVAALALDNPTAETLPYDPAEGWAHHRLIPLLGLPLGELWWLRDLAQVCRRESRYSFLLASSPLNLPGAAGSPANAYAVL